MKTESGESIETINFGPGPAGPVTAFLVPRDPQIVEGGKLMEAMEEHQARRFGARLATGNCCVAAMQADPFFEAKAWRT